MLYKRIINYIYNYVYIYIYIYILYIYTYIYILYIYTYIYIYINTKVFKIWLLMKLGTAKAKENLVTT